MVTSIVEAVEGLTGPGVLGDLAVVVVDSCGGLDGVEGAVEPDEQPVAANSRATRQADTSKLRTPQLRRLHPLCVCVRFVIVNLKS